MKHNQPPFDFSFARVLNGKHSPTEEQLLRSLFAVVCPTGCRPVFAANCGISCVRQVAP
jgi:hypothetical protein